MLGLNSIELVTSSVVNRDKNMNDYLHIAKLNSLLHTQQINSFDIV
jgi:hypothetical protein